MAPKSSDGNTTEEENTVLETTESMDGSTENDDSPTLRKRKADMSLDSCSSEDNKEEKETEKEVDSCESDQAWGFDSFDDTDYDPDTDDEDDDFEWNRYLRHVYSTRGFNVDREMVPKRLFQGVRPFNLNDATFRLKNMTGREYMDSMVKLALDRFNKENKTNVTCDHVVRVMVRQSIGVKSYITFMAREFPLGDLIEYQAKTQWKVWQRNAHAIFCRPTPPIKRPIPEKYFQKISAAELQWGDPNEVMFIWFAVNELG